jgi:hypothetical protein
MLFKIVAPSFVTMTSPFDVWICDQSELVYDSYFEYSPFYPFHGDPKTFEQRH